MKQLQNNFTTPEQSKRLLEIGLPADSADFFYDLEANNPPHANRIPWFLDTTYSELSDEFGSRAFLPCWSVGRLIEIYDTCVQSQFNSEVTWCNVEYVKNKLGKTYIEYLVNIFAVHIKDLGDVDFSKLED